MKQNPYTPPVEHPSNDARFKIGLSLWSFVPPAITAAITIVLWVALVSILGNTSSKMMEMGVWAGSLLLSLFVATAMVTRFWRSATAPLAFVIVSAGFAGLFCLLEGDTSDGADQIQSLTVYGTLLAVPMVAGVTSWLVPQKREKAPTESED